MMLRRALPAMLLLAALGGWLAVPVRWRVEGLSMAPGLMPGDIAASGWFPGLDSWRTPERFERWTLVEPDGALALKRVWALPGEEIAIVDGDVAVDGAVVVKPPAVLAELALPVPHAITRRTATAVEVAIDDPVFDDVSFAPGERRLLVPVRDIGIVAVVHATTPFGRSLPAVEVGVGDRTARVGLAAAGGWVVVAGRLDGCFAAGAWPLEEGSAVAAGAVVPGRTSTAWNLERPWVGFGPVETCTVTVVGGGERSDLRIERVAVWRDMHALAPADGTARWRLGPAECLVLGDFPAGSRDSRHWGPLDASRLRHRLAMPCVR